MRKQICVCDECGVQSDINPNWGIANGWLDVIIKVTGEEKVKEIFVQLNVLLII